MNFRFPPNLASERIASDYAVICKLTSAKVGFEILFYDINFVFGRAKERTEQREIDACEPKKQL